MNLLEVQDLKKYFEPITVRSMLLTASAFAFRPMKRLAL